MWKIGESVVMVGDVVVLEVVVVFVVEVVVSLVELHPVNRSGASRMITQKIAQ
jgi:hypothetical protein